MTTTRELHPPTPAPAARPLPADYAERVYAGIVGKLIGVYLGRPFEGWPQEKIEATFGEVNYYVHDQLNMPLVVTDDDLSGTFTFLRALEDYGYSPDLSPAQIGQTWLNYILEGRTILWWGGLGNSTEHTAYLRLKAGIPAPESGSTALNGARVAEQIGAQIFIDGWGLVAPGNPALAADLAGRAARVSHDGAAVHAARLLAAMVAQAFVERDLNALLDVGLGFVPRDSIIRRVVDDLRAWRTETPDWREALRRVQGRYGYDRYGGNCHVVPNHALVILALLYGEGDFQRSLMIVNTSGWDTDCNSGNVGCLLGVVLGLSGLEAGPDWRSPVADRLFLPSADGARAITDALTETYHVVNAGRALAGLERLSPKGGARFHFELPGAVQGFTSATPELLRLENVAGHSRLGARSLALRCVELASGRVAHASTPTFMSREDQRVAEANSAGYQLIASPTVYPGQRLTAGVGADPRNARPLRVRLVLRRYGAGDEPARVAGPEVVLAPGGEHTLEWTVPDTGGQPILDVGLELSSPDGARADGTVYLDHLGWSGVPEVTLARPAEGGQMWRAAWVNGVDGFEDRWPEAYRLVQNGGTGLVIQGAREWTDYRVRATVTPHLLASGGLAARVQGLRRYYALVFADGGRLRLVKALDGETVLAETNWPWEMDAAYGLELEVRGPHLRASVDGTVVFEVEDEVRPLLSGAVGLLCESGMLGCDAVQVCP